MLCDDLPILNTTNTCLVIVRFALHFFQVSIIANLATNGGLDCGIKASGETCSTFACEWGDGEKGFAPFGEGMCGVVAPVVAGFFPSCDSVALSIVALWLAKCANGTWSTESARCSRMFSHPLVCPFTAPAGGDSRTYERSFCVFFVLLLFSCREVHRSRRPLRREENRMRSQTVQLVILVSATKLASTQEPLPWPQKPFTWLVRIDSQLTVRGLVLLYFLFAPSLVGGMGSLQSGDTIR